MYQYILFDLDGTLTNPKEGITKCVQYALADQGIEEPNLDKLTPFIGPPLLDSFQEYYHMNLEQCRKALGKYRERFATVGIFENSVLPGVPEMLQQLRKKGKTLAVASSKPEEFVIRILEKFEILSYFDEVAGASMDGKRTAKADVIREALRRMEISEEEKKQVIMVGDRRHDVEGAKECGLDCLGVYVGFAEPGELEQAGAAYIADTVEGMSRFLQDN
ncbi:MAG: HAD family hydrolase [Lachnospiraceae bacterium]|nr:HAD family hydrolase [Lachnospiraceae bacterium]MDD3795150.1 HAD family hydrolase [Lachnospiraceae bacterium]